MSVLTYHEAPYGPRVELWTNSRDERFGTFWLLNCDEHGDTLHFTDIYGTDVCTECVEKLLEPSTPNIEGEKGVL